MFGAPVSESESSPSSGLARRRHRRKALGRCRAWRTCGPPAPGLRTSAMKRAPASELPIRAAADFFLVYHGTATAAPPGQAGVAFSCLPQLRSCFSVQFARVQDENERGSRHRDGGERQPPTCRAEPAPARPDQMGTPDAEPGTAQSLRGGRAPCAYGGGCMACCHAMHASEPLAESLCPGHAAAFARPGRPRRRGRHRTSAPAPPAADRKHYQV